MKLQVDVLERAAEQTEPGARRVPQHEARRARALLGRDQPLENEGDQLFRRAVAGLFSGDHRAMDVLRWKEVIETLEEALDGLENVANVIESVVLKHA